MSVELRERDLGEVIGLSFQLATEQFGRLFLLQLLVVLPGLAFQLWLQPELRPEQVQGLPPDQAMRLLGDFIAEFMVVLLAQAVFAPLAAAAIPFIMADCFHGRPVSLPRALREGARRYPGMLLFMLTLGVLQGLGACTLYLATALFTVWFFVSGPAMVLERISWVDAFARSRDLTAGYRWEVLALFLVTWLGPAFLIGMIAGFLEVAVPSYWARAILAQLVGMVIGIVPLAAPTVVYYHLRVVKEAYDVERLAELVDRIGADPPGA